MIRAFSRLSMRRAQAARAFGRRSAARFRLRLYAPSGYPWPTQRSPKFVFAVLLARWLTNRTVKERALSAERRSRQPRREAMRRQLTASHTAGRSKRSTPQRHTSLAAKTLRVPARAISARSARPLAERRIADHATSRGAIAYRRVAPSDRAIASWRATVAPREVVKTRWLGRDRISREVETRFIERSARAVFVAVAAPRSGVRNDGRVWRSPQRAIHVMTQSARRRRESAVPHRADASRRRVAMIARSAHRAHTLTNRRSVNAFVSSSRSGPRHNERRRADRGKREATRLLIHERVLKLKPVQIHRIALGARIARAMSAPRTDLVRAQNRRGRADISALRFSPRRIGGPHIAAVSRPPVHRHASPQRRFLAEQSVSSPQDRAVVTLARYESVVRPAMIVRQRIESASSREQAEKGARQAHTVDDSRTGAASYQDDRSDNRPARPPAIEEVRRILIPLLQETLFSERTMGRLANGVVSDIDRRDSVERYRKTGGR